MTTPAETKTKRAYVLLQVEVAGQITAEGLVSTQLPEAVNRFCSTPGFEAGHANAVILIDDTPVPIVRPGEVDVLIPHTDWNGIAVLSPVSRRDSWHFVTLGQLLNQPQQA